MQGHQVLYLLDQCGLRQIMLTSYEYLHIIMYMHIAMPSKLHVNSHNNNIMYL